MSRVLPILFNTEMVRAILDGRKTVTRRLVKHDVDAILNSPYHKEHTEVEDKQIISKLCMSPYQPGDILYVRETWGEGYEEGTYIYRADDKLAGLPTFKESSKLIYHPSIHMPKEAARIWIKVTDVRVERLQEITSEQIGRDTTKAQRTGCSMCGFGIHMEKRPHRFDLLYESNPKEWDYLMFHMCKDKDGNDYGWAKVLDYIGVGWDPTTIGGNCKGQMSLPLDQM